MSKYTYKKDELLELFFKYSEEIKLRFSMKNVLFDNENMYLDNILETYKTTKNNFTINSLLLESSKTCDKQDVGKVLSLQDRDLTVAINSTYREFKPNTFEEVEHFGGLVCCKYYYNQFVKNINTIIKYLMCFELINYICNIKTIDITLYKDVSSIELFDNYIDNEVLPRYQHRSYRPLLEIKNIELGNLCTNSLTC